MSAFRASRYSRGEQEDGDYINCPFDKDQYYAFVEALNGAERIELRTFEADIQTGVRAGASEFFEGCLPVEVLARRDPKALAYGPLRPVGLYDPHTGAPSLRRFTAAGKIIWQAICTTWLVFKLT
jgi:methylenetetrahydrofolate--tRNA-(uracil-5-)-methyltransferase